MVDLGLLLVDLTPELELNVVISLEGVGVAGEGERLGLDIELQIRLLDIGDGDGEIDEVLGFVGLARALSPKDWGVLAVVSSCDLRRLSIDAGGGWIAVPAIG